MGLEAAKSLCYGVSIDRPNWRASLYKCTSAKTAQNKVLATIRILTQPNFLPPPPASAWKTLGDTGLSSQDPPSYPHLDLDLQLTPSKHSFSFFCARSQRTSLCCSFSPSTRSRALSHLGRSTFLGLKICSLLGPRWAPRSNFRSSIRSVSLPKPYGSWWIVNNVMPTFRILIRAVH